MEIKRITAIVLDTNFIYANNKNIQDILNTTNSNYKFYVPEIVVKELVSQRIRDEKKLFIEAKSCEEKLKSIIKIDYLKIQEDYLIELENEFKNKYNQLFENIVPLEVSDEIFQEVVNRAMSKKSPFNINEKSDSGFKDTIIWISLLHFFKLNKDEFKEVYFLSDDKAFKENNELVSEFIDYTDLKINLKGNYYIKELIKNSNVTTNNLEKDKYTSISTITQVKNNIDSEMRKKIRNTIESVCNFDVEEYYGITNYDYFALRNQLSVEDVKYIFEKLNDNYFKNSMIDEIVPSNIIVTDYDIMNLHCIPNEKIVDLIDLYEEVKENYYDYLEPFYFAVAQILNSNFDINYENNYIKVKDIDELPF